MPSLQTHLKSLDFSHRLVEVKNLMSTAQAETTFWGGRIVKVVGFTGSLSLEDLGKRVLKVGRERCDTDDLTPEERIAGLEIIQVLRNFYQVTDRQIRESNPFTQFLNWIREFSINPCTTRFHIAGCGKSKDYFREYNERRFLEAFGGKFGAFYHHPDSRGTSGFPPRIIAKDDAIRRLLV